MRALLPYQIPALDWVSSRDQAMLLLDMRLGKAVLSPRWAEARGARNVLLVTVPSAIPDWLKVLTTDGYNHVWMQGSGEEKFSTACEFWDSPGLYPRFYITNTQGLFKPNAPRCSMCKGTGKMVTGFYGDKCPRCHGRGKLRRRVPLPAGCALLPYDACIWDEITTIKNPQAQITSMAHELAKRIPLRLGLSGDLAPETELNVFEPMKWVYGRFMGEDNFWEWRNAHFHQQGFKWMPLPGHLSLLHKSIAAHSYRMTRKQAGVEKVPPKFKRIEIELPKQIRTQYDYLEDHLQLPYDMIPDPDEKDYEDIVCKSKHLIAVRTWLREIAGGYPKHWRWLWSPHKIETLITLLRGPLSGKQIPITFAFDAEIIATHARLKNERLSVEMFRGDMDPPQRMTTLRRFQSGQTQYLLMQYAVMSHGMDLSVASEMVRFSLTWRAEHLNQSKDRLFNPMRENILTYYDLVVKDSIDEDLLAASLEKRGTSRYFMTIFEKHFTDRIRRKSKTA